MATDLFPPALVKISTPASASCMMRGHQLRRRGRRRGHLMVNCISKGQKKLIAPFQPCCDQSCLRARYLRQRRQQCHQRPQFPTTLRVCMTLQDPAHHPITILLHLCLLHSPLQLLTKISSHTYHHGIIQILLGIPRLLERHRAGMAQTWTQDLRFTVYPQFVSAVNRCCLVLGVNQEPYQRCLTRC